MTDEWARQNSASGREGGRASDRHPTKAVPSAQTTQTGAARKREGKGPGIRKRASARPGTSSTSPKQIEMAKRRARALELREMAYSYEQIAQHLHVTKSTIERDIQRALKELVVEPAHVVFAIEMRRIDALLSTYMADALNGDSNAANVCLRYMQHRANLLGWSKPDMAAKLTIHNTDEPIRALSLEFVLPSGERFNTLDQPSHHHRHHDVHCPNKPLQAIGSSSPSSSPPSSSRIAPHPDDVVLDRVQPNSFRKPRGGL